MLFTLCTLLRQNVTAPRSGSFHLPGSSYLESAFQGLSSLHFRHWCFSYSFCSLPNGQNYALGTIVFSLVLGFFPLGDNTVVIVRPSNFGGASTTAISARSSQNCATTFCPRSICNISLPRNIMEIRTLLPFIIKSRACFTFVWKSCVSIFGFSLISLTLMTTCAFLLSFSFFAWWYRSLP